MQLSNVAISSSKTSHPSPLPTPSPHERSSSHSVESQTPRMPPAMSQYHSSPGNISSSFKSMRIENVDPNLIPRHQTPTPSGLSLLLANRRPEPLSLSSREAGLPGSLESLQSLTPQPPISLNTSPPLARAAPQPPGPQGPSPQPSEETPLLAQSMAHYTSYPSAEAGLPHLSSKSKFRMRLVSASRTACANSGDFFVVCARSLPSVLLGLLLNMLDGISCELFREYYMIPSLTDGTGQMV